MLWWDWPKPVPWNRDHDSTTGCVGSASANSPVCREGLVRPVLVVDSLQERALTRCSMFGYHDCFQSFKHRRYISSWYRSTSVHVVVTLHSSLMHGMSIQSPSKFLRGRTNGVDHECESQSSRSADAERKRVLASNAFDELGCFSPSLAMRMALARAVLMRGLAANFAGKGKRQVGQVFFPWFTHLLKHPRQKLCWQGAYKEQKAVTGWHADFKCYAHLRAILWCLIFHDMYVILP